MQPDAAHDWRHCPACGTVRTGYAPVCHGCLATAPWPKRLAWASALTRGDAAAAVAAADDIVTWLVKERGHRG